MGNFVKIGGGAFWQTVLPKIAQNSLNNGFQAVLTPFLDFNNFDLSAANIAFFRSNFWFFCSTKNTLVNPIFLKLLITP